MVTRVQQSAKYTSAAAAWEFQKMVHESAEIGHRFGAPLVEQFTFVGTKYTATCLNCDKEIYVSGGWGGPAAYGPCANRECHP